MARSWLITGCSKGLGWALAEHLIARGENVIATARRPESLEALVAGHPNAHATKLDVTDRGDIGAAVKAGEEAFGGIDVLVNNAGYGYIAAVEEAEEDAYRALYETNLFGLMALTRAVLPAMRRRGSGHIINISSTGGMIGNPGSAFYAGTKFAVIGFSEALSKEMAPLGVKVTAVLPGPFRTEWQGPSLRTSKHFISAYRDTVHARLQTFAATNGQQPGDPRRAAEAIIAAAGDPEPPLHLILGKPGLEAVRKHLTTLTREINAWEHVTLSADYPDA
ncbi:oxidoreductase [Muricoccus pecuniae]|uniref:NAD(P)-dependent dehydrogenase (Short-subunit alcohol dehydrogenase family) n=1 Tax=Muricoccus pecuniae TaxID=693023 RepID=A0A840Y8C7_9PROT|nr:oxidoreductase [Roseomonas pecuniae]MBB5696180.1 NAD(P)-dependent dehydrogenase (short-subunit alcohol dehydrogenase family) [Roseomonas pecuniae]